MTANEKVCEYINVFTQVLPKITEAQQKALSFLEGEVTGLTDVYDLAIVTYSLRLAGSPRAGEAWGKLNAKAIEQGTVN